MRKELIKKVLLGSTFLFLTFLIIIVSFYFKHYLSRDTGQVKMTGQPVDVVEVLKASQLVNFNGDPISIDNSVLDAETIVMHFWASWCEPCITEIPEFLESIEHNKSSTKYIAISMDHNKDDLFRFLKNFPKLNSDLVVRVWDAESNFAAQFKIEKLPATIIKSKQKDIKRIDGIVDWKNLTF